MRSAAALAGLRARIAVLEGSAPAGADPVGWSASRRVVELGVPAVDGLLPWGGLPFGALHEVAAQGSAGNFQDGPALGFAARMLARLAGARARPALWISETGLPYGPGLAGLGLGPGRLVLVAGGRPSEILWALEEAARSLGPGAVLGEVRGMAFTAARRLALAARDSGAAVLLLNRSAEAIKPALTRWRIGALPSEPAPGVGVGLGVRRWRVELAACRGLGLTQGDHVAAWDVEWDGDACGLRLAAQPADRSSAAPAARVA